MLSTKRWSGESTFDASAWISQSEAARLRGVSRQAIAGLAKKNRFKTLNIGGKDLVNRMDVVTYQNQPRGPKTMEKHKEIKSTPPQDRRSPDAKQSESGTPGKKNQGINRLNNSTIKFQQSGRLDFSGRSRTNSRRFSAGHCQLNTSRPADDSQYGGALRRSPY
jgi:hypothetical protein